MKYLQSIDLFHLGWKVHSTSAGCLRGKKKNYWNHMKAKTMKSNREWTTEIETWLGNETTSILNLFKYVDRKSYWTAEVQRLLLQRDAWSQPASLLDDAEGLYSYDSFCIWLEKQHVFKMFPITFQAHLTTPGLECYGAMVRALQPGWALSPTLCADISLHPYRWWSVDGCQRCAGQY